MGASQRKAFEETKKMLCSAPLQTHFNPTKPILVQVDGSPYGLGAVMAHKMEDGSERPVCYSRNYAHIEKEGLALVFAVKKCSSICMGTVSEYSEDDERNLHNTWFACVGCEW